MEADTKSIFIGLLAVFMLIPAMLFAESTGKKPLVGVWEVQVSPVEQSQLPMLSLAMFSGDGSFTTGVGYKALPVVPALQDIATELGPGYGRWAATDNAGEFRLTFYSVMWKAGRVNGYQRVQDTFVLSESGDEYLGPARTDFLDRNWNVVFSTTNEVKARRLETPNTATLVGKPAEKKPLVGVWVVKESPAGPSHSSLLSLAMFSGDGSFSTTGGYKALPAVPGVRGVATEIGSGYGRWVGTGEREFRLTFYSVMWKEGLVNGYQRVRDTLVLSESGDEYTGHAQVDFLDAKRNVVFSTATDVEGTKLETPNPAIVSAQQAERKGVWEVKASLPGQSVPPLLGLILLGDDGSFTQSIGSVLPPIPVLQAVANEIGPSYGHAVRTGDREFRLTFYAVLWKAGLVNGFQRLQSIEIMSESGDEWTSRAHSDLVDANWNVVFTLTSDAKGTRLETPGKD
jgi:hypothetical protein